MRVRRAEDAAVVGLLRQEIILARLSLAKTQANIFFVDQGSPLVGQQKPRGGSCPLRAELFRWGWSQ
jgi:hypothetical protein